MTRTLQSYSEGRWQDGTGELRVLVDPTTGEEVVRIAEVGPDPEATVGFARDVGGPGIRELTFQERASCLRQLAKWLTEHSEDMTALSTRTGSTRRDTTLDVGGGIATLAFYAYRAAKEMPDGYLLSDGELEMLGKGGTFGGQHFYSSKVGAALQINAFNFPVWGMLEKFAAAFLAGVPSVVKPASQTAYLAELAVAKIVESSLLPEGSLSLFCGAPNGLLRVVSSQDTISFTGSARTAELIRNDPAVVGSAVAFNAEADSLNCSILGLDVSVGDPEFNLFVEQLVTEMTVKAGQKCTAIRRAFIPTHLFESACEMVVQRLSEIRVGNPADESVDMGPLASRSQRDEVRGAVHRLSRVCEVVFGDTEHVDLVDANEKDGAFLSPLLLRCHDRKAGEPHNEEAFGPVSTLLPYDSVGEAVEGAALGGGSLVGSIVTHDQGFAKAVVSGLCPWHGRILVLDRSDAIESTGHGVVVPQMFHGGPGRAGGGGELGGLRALSHYMQRTGVQGPPDLLRALSEE